MSEYNTGFLKQIKEATAEQHTAMEADPLLAQLLSPQLTRAQYICYLSLFLKVSEAYEANILPISISTLSPWKVTPPSEKIYRDLQLLGVEIPIEPVQAYRLPDAFSGPAFALGFTYVMEGSKLGGKVLARAVCKTLGLSESAGVVYLSDHGQDSFPLWKQFIDQFAEFIIFFNGEKQAIEGANQAFASIAAFFAANSGLYEL
jgi:heme oxygenase